MVSRDFMQKILALERLSFGDFAEQNRAIPGYENDVQKTCLFFAWRLIADWQDVVRLGGGFSKRICERISRD